VVALIQQATDAESVNNAVRAALTRKVMASSDSENLMIYDLYPTFANAFKILPSQLLTAEIIVSLRAVDILAIRSTNAVQCDLWRMINRVHTFVETQRLVISRLFVTKLLGA
jgi:adenylate kinase family enzyme